MASSASSPKGVCHERHVPADVVGEDVGVARKRREVVAAGTALVGHEYDAVTRIGELADRLRVALEPAVVLRFSVFDRGVEESRAERGRASLPEGRRWCRKRPWVLVVDEIFKRWFSGATLPPGCQTSRPQLRSVAYASS